MYADISKPPASLPSIKLEVLRPGLSLLWPLSRRGHSPGLIILSTTREDPVAFYDGIPSSMVKWADEGYAVVQIEVAGFEGEESEVVLREAIETLRQCEKCELNDKIGLVAPAVEIVTSVLYADAQTVESLAPSVKPLLKHLANQDFRPASQSQYPYRKATTYAFATPSRSHFDYTTELVSHTRNLQFLKPKLNGPYFDLEAIWDEHTWYEFSDRSVEHTMGTMVQEPYVNHVPTLTGVISRLKLSKFYRDNFIFNNSLDTRLDLISRTIGMDRVIDEFIYTFTHNREIDWLLPGIPPTVQKAELPFTAVGTALRQLGLMPEYLPFPYPVPNAGENPGTKYEYRIPVTGIETAAKIRDRNAVPSNERFDFKVREVQQDSKDNKRD
ncbi:related to dienelactone hydrolase and related enzymes [Fusarium torulosum]|uniref:Related to dienelactone hydrolase and related enzymes n=1 Tax=Fusarium torulosum TaxID=33205 RepID=A0AAE8SGA0_9HYPO|nr:related to dienelactone hydrolase and related enzymes [Fusarium torulosum]